MSKRTAIFLIFMFCLCVDRVSYSEEVNLRETPIVNIVRENKDAVVNISTQKTVLLRENPFWGNYGRDLDMLFDDFYSGYHPSYALKLKSVGSGVIVDKSGIIVTNTHVVNMATDIIIILNDGTKIEGKVVYEDPNSDLALIKIGPPKELKEIKCGVTTDVMIGETVIAIGNPLGLENTVTSGIISGKDRKLYAQGGSIVSEKLLQIDAPINPGNSGGALLNMNGELIGITVAVVQNSQSIGFAVPVEKVKELIEDYKNNKNIKPVDKKAAKRPQSSKGQKSTSFFVNMNPNVEVEDKEKEYIVKLNIPGINKDKVALKIGKGSIVISGEYSQEESKEGDGSSYEIKSFGSFVKTIPMPDDADIDSIRTKKTNDAIIINIPKIQKR